jgi:hypothetical protein
VVGVAVEAAVAVTEGALVANGSGAVVVTILSMGELTVGSTSPVQPERNTIMITNPSKRKHFIKIFFLLLIANFLAPLIIICHQDPGETVEQSSGVG